MTLSDSRWTVWDVVMAAQKRLPDDQILRWLVVGTQQIDNRETVSSAGLHLAEHVTAVVGASPPLQSYCSQLPFSPDEGSSELRQEPSVPLSS